MFLALAFVSCDKGPTTNLEDNTVLSNTETASPQTAQTPAPTQTPIQVIVKNSPVPTQKPTSNLYAGLVVIDAGHGGNDPGTAGNGLVEKEITLDIAKKLNEILISNNISTYMIRTEDVFLDHKKRIAIANEKSAALYISIHCDWFNNPKYGGTQTFYINKSDLKYGNLTELQYAKNVQNELIKTMKSNNRGISERGDLAVTKYAQMPSVLVELGFLSNPTDSANLATTDYRQKYKLKAMHIEILCMALIYCLVNSETNASGSLLKYILLKDVLFHLYQANETPYPLIVQNFSFPLRTRRYGFAFHKFLFSRPLDQLTYSYA